MVRSFEPRFAAKETEISAISILSSGAAGRTKISILSKINLESRRELRWRWDCPLPTSPKRHAGQKAGEDSRCELESTSKEERHHQTRVDRESAHNERGLEGGGHTAP